MSDGTPTPLLLPLQPSPFEERRPEILAACRTHLDSHHSHAAADHANGASGSVIVHRLATIMDEMLASLYQAVASDPVATSCQLTEHLALVALGGYGRGELNPKSDVDIMFLHDGSIPPQIIEGITQKFLYLLWDLRLEIGSSVRTPADCISMAQQDTTVKTALLDCRYLTGARVIFDALHKSIFKDVLPRTSDKFIKEKIDEMRRRRHKFGSSIYLLEPNIKEGEGGLRDLQTALWVAKIRYKIDRVQDLVLNGVMSDSELATYLEALDYLWRIRNELHFHTKRHTDQLTFDLQSHLALFMGYNDADGALAVEEFMRDYYRRAARIEHLVSSLCARCQRQDEGGSGILGYFVRRPVGDGCFVLKGELIIPDESIVEGNPVVLMRIFELAQKHEVKLSLAAKALVRRSLHMIDDSFRRSREVNVSFMSILRSPKGVTNTLRLMHHLELLNRFIPEFEQIYCKVQHDMYHIYTVDIHTLFAVEQIEMILGGDLAEQLPLPTRIARQIGKRELLILAVMFHDIGKGLGGGHAEKGAAMIPTIARRLGLNREDSQRLEFLVRQHLVFAHIAQRRDLSDELMIANFSRLMETSENLKMLYLLTVADVRAVGADVWTNWKAMLFDELYDKTYNILERGGFALEGSSERARSVRRAVRLMVEHDIPENVAKAELKQLPNRYLLSTPTETIAKHLRLLVAQESQGLVITIEHEPELGFSNLIICTIDTYGLFARICGVLAANSVNILGAQIHTAKNGKVLDILQVNSAQGHQIRDQHRWDKIEQDLDAVLRGTQRVETLMEKRQKSLVLSKTTRALPTRVEIDNQVSNDYTVIDIYAQDKVGLLYMITNMLNQMGLYIGVSRISTKVDQVADVFYVRDIFGHKITSDEKLEEVVTSLSWAIDDWS